jgi:hypothetical protein
MMDKLSLQVISGTAIPMILAPLVRPVPLTVKVLEGKSVRRRGLPESVLQLSAESTVITFEEPPEPMTNIEMNLADLPEEIKEKNFYGKVVGDVETDEESRMVRFTSVPPEVNAYFQALLKYDAEGRGS